MYKKQLEADLRKIYGVKKVLFASVESGWEQGALYVDVSNVWQNIRHGQQHFRVRGTLGMWGVSPAYKTGFLKDKLWEASRTSTLKEIADRILLFDNEENVKYPDMESYFNQTEIGFIYRVNMDYDPSKKTKGFSIKTFFTKLLKG